MAPLSVSGWLFRARYEGNRCGSSWGSTCLPHPIVDGMRACTGARATTSFNLEHREKRPPVTRARGMRKRREAHCDATVIFVALMDAESRLISCEKKIKCNNFGELRTETHGITHELRSANFSRWTKRKITLLETIGGSLPLSPSTWQIISGIFWITFTKTRAYDTILCF